MKLNPRNILTMLTLSTIFLLAGCQGSGDLAQGLDAASGLSSRKRPTVQPTEVPQVIIPPTPTPTSVPIPPPSGHIVFISSRNGKKTLYLMNADGTDQTPLTSGTEDSSPRWSPDGAQIAFSSIANKTAEIDILNVADKTLFRLTNNSGSDAFPSWSSDGQQVAFESFQSGRWSIYVINSDGSGLSPLANDDNGDINPVWSPRDALIAFVSNHNGGNANIYLARPNQAPIKLTNDTYPSTDPVWSPDGSQIAYRFYSSPQVANICVINRDGSNHHCLTDSQWENGIPAWSPDGHWLAFRSIRSGTSDIDLIDLESGVLSTLITGVSVKGDPIWSPDGYRLVFQGCPQNATSQNCAANTNIQLYSIVVDTHEVTQLTNSPGYNGDPAWTAR